MYIRPIRALMVLALGGPVASLLINATNKIGVGAIASLLFCVGFEGFWANGSVAVGKNKGGVLRAFALLSHVIACKAGAR